jgi:hypothetical protein
MAKYAECNTKAARGIASHPGDPLSLATAARGICLSVEAELWKNLRNAHADYPEVANRAIERARQTILEHNAAEIVSVRAAREANAGGL